MGRRIACPQCRHEFWLHGAGTGTNQAVVKCYECGMMFNPRKQSAVPEGS